LTLCYPIGILEMNDSGATDEKIIAICSHDPLYNSFKDIKELPQHILDEIMHFFKVYKELEHGKTTRIDKIYGVEKAKDVIRKALKRYDEKFPDAQ
jgi:inorganic pyrophosphatase